MNMVPLDLFVTPPSDIERHQFVILNELQKVRAGFSHNRIYPTLAELTELYTTLKQISQRAEDIRLVLPKRITGADIQNRRIIYEEIHLQGDDLATVLEVINWSLPHLERLLNEGRTIFDFVDEHMKVEEVGILPTYLDEGYLMVPELVTMSLHVFRYEVTIFTKSQERYRNLKTTEVRSVPFSSVNATPWHLKSTLIAEHRELPNPATYYFDTDLDFPFNETILPVAKRKLLRQIFS